MIGSSRLGLALVLLSSTAAASGLHVEQRDSRYVLVDTQGRERLLRGVNLATLGEHGGAGSQVPIDTALYLNGSCPSNNNHWYQPPICEHDISELKAVGFDSVRLLVHWSQIEPEPGQYNKEYFARVNQIIDWAERYGVSVLIDFHQVTLRILEPVLSIYSLFILIYDNDYWTMLLY